MPGQAALNLTTGSRGKSRNSRAAGPVFIVLTVSLFMIASGTFLAIGRGVTNTTLLPASQPQGSPDFTITANPSIVTVPNGSWAEVNLTLASINGYQGPVKLQAYVVSAGSAFASSEGLYLFWQGIGGGTLTPGSRVNATLEVDGYQSHFHGWSQIWIDAEGLCIFHRTFVSVIQPPLLTAANFQISANPAKLTITPGNQGSSRISVTSVSGFSGEVSLLAIGVKFSLSPRNLTLSPGGTQSSQLTFQILNKQCTVIEDILIVATSGSTSQATIVAVAPPETNSSGSTPPLANAVAALLQSLRANAFLISATVATISGGSVVAILVLLKRTKHD